MSNSNSSEKCWYLKYFDDGIIAHIEIEKIKEIFKKEYISSKKTAHKNYKYQFFIKHTNNELHCKISIYFSPACFKVAKLIDAEPCFKPNLSQLELVVCC